MTDSRYMSVLYGEDSIIIRLPYDVAVDNSQDECFAAVIHQAIVSIWEYVNDYYEHEVHVDWHREPLSPSLYPSKTYMMYKDLLDFVNQYMQLQLIFADFVGITYDSITPYAYHSDTYFAYCIDIEFEDEYCEEYDPCYNCTNDCEGCQYSDNPASVKYEMGNVVDN